MLSLWLGLEDGHVQQYGSYRRHLWIATYPYMHTTVRPDIFIYIHIYIDMNIDIHIYVHIHIYSYNSHIYAYIYIHVHV